ncbi:15384_t:CDS:1 [Funneliformis caledonium]|uniref:15384_t:CDS:1 n=1 Tax=Funneliformis caledonium TaxID=1117310 RepID=A0A9N9H971_9GLOM|nr:15384_t:CDS:1 [Funneliformis caledonium]
MLLSSEKTHATLNNLKRIYKELSETEFIYQKSPMLYKYTNNLGRIKLEGNLTTEHVLATIKNNILNLEKAKTIKQIQPKVNVNYEQEHQELASKEGLAKW